MRTNAGEFKDIVVDTEEIHLDALNPRIDVATYANQDQIRAALLQTEEIRELAEGIVENGGMMPGERIILLKEGNAYVVLEGNRRICACQLLLDRSLIPAGHKAKFPALDEDIRNRIGELQADLAPSREAAEVVITKRHTDPGIKRWSIVAKQRRIARYLNEGHTIEQAAEYYKEDLYDLKRQMQGFNLLAKVRSLPNWTPEEKRRLVDPGLVVNPFVRFFQLSGAKGAFGMTFDDEGKILVEGSDQDYEQSLENVARMFLLPNAKGKRTANTRATPDEILPQVLVGRLKTAWKQSAKKTRSSRKTTRHTPRARAPKFFENALSCTILDDRLAQVCEELNRIDYVRFRLASAFLVRALVEAALQWCIRKYGLTKQLRTEWETANPNAKYGPGLEFILGFVIRHHATIFADREIRRPLGQWLSQHKDGIDMVIHGKWRTTITPAMLEQLAAVIRPAMQRIVDQTALA